MPGESGVESKSSSESVQLTSYQRQKIASLKKQGRDFKALKTEGDASSPGGAILSYVSKGNPALNINGKFLDENGEEILCRQLAYEFIYRCEHEQQTHGTYYQSLFGSKLTIEAVDRLYENRVDSDRVLKRADRYAAGDVENCFSDLLYEMCRDMLVGDRKRLLVLSESHVMGLHVNYDAARGVIVKFFDPNCSMVHHRLVLSSLDCLSCVDMSDFMSKAGVDFYFEELRTVIIAEYPDKAEDLSLSVRKPSIVRLSADGEDIGDMLYSLADIGLLDSFKQVCNYIVKDIDRLRPKLWQQLKAKNYLDESLLVSMRYAEAQLFLDYFLDFIFSLNMPLREKLDYLALQEADGNILWQIWKSGVDGAFERYINRVLKSGLPWSAKEALLTFRHSSCHDSLEVLLAGDDDKNLKTYVSMILASDLHASRKARLLGLNTSRNLPVIVALKDYEMKMWDLYITLILESNLTESKKVQLLSLNHPGSLQLSDYIKDAQTDRVIRYLDLILASTLSSDAKKQLSCLSAVSVFNAVSDILSVNIGHVSAVAKYVEIIANSTLSDDDKVDLIGFSDDDDIVILNNSLQQGLSAAFVMQYIRAIIDSNMGFAAKCELVGNVSEFGNTFLDHAFYNNHPRLVRAYVESILRSCLDEHEKVRLLLSKNARGLCAFDVGMKMSSLECVSTYLSSVLGSDLSAQAKCELLEAKNDQQLGVLEGFLSARHFKSVYHYIERVILSRLPDAMKYRLLSVTGSLGVHFLHVFDSKQIRSAMNLMLGAQVSTELRQQFARLFTADPILHSYLTDMPAVQGKHSRTFLFACGSEASSSAKASNTVSGVSLDPCKLVF